GSWVWAVGNDWDNAIARTVGPNQTKVDEYLAATGDTFWVQSQTSPTPAAGTAVTINCTSPTSDRWNLSLIEVRPAPSSGPNSPRSVSLTKPLAGVIKTPTTTTTIQMAASASDVDGTVSKVEFFQGSTNVGQSLTAPYTCQWTGVPPGSYKLTARATDNVG